MELTGGRPSNSSATCVLQFSQAMLMIAINGNFCVVGLIGNVFVCVAVFKVPDLRKLGNAYLVVLAVVDFLTCAIVQPLLIVMVIEEVNHRCHDTLETVFRAVGNFTCAVSFLLLCCITTERFLAIVKPITSITFHRKRRFYISTSISLIIPFIYTVVRMTVSKKDTSYFSAVILVVGYSYIISCYLAILVQLRRQSKRIALLTTQEDVKRRQAEKAVTMTIAIVIAIFTVMWVPFFYYRICKPLKNSGVGYNWVRTTAISNSALNPIVYALRMKQFREAFK